MIYVLLLCTTQILQKSRLQMWDPSPSIQDSEGLIQVKLPGIDSKGGTHPFRDTKG